MKTAGVATPKPKARGSRSFPAATAGMSRVGEKTTVVFDKERCEDITYSPSFQKWSFHLQPGNSALFPRLSKRAVTYERYRFRKLLAHYVPGATTVTEGVIAALKYRNLERATPQNMHDLLNNSHAVNVAPWQGFTMNLLDRGREPWRYVWEDLLAPTGFDPRLNDAGYLIIASAGGLAAASGAFCGSLWIEYEVELSDGASLDFASPLDEWRYLRTGVVANLDPAGGISTSTNLFSLLRPQDVDSSTSYGNLMLIEASSPTDNGLAPIQPVEGNLLINLNGSNFDNLGVSRLNDAATWINTKAEDLKNWSSQATSSALSLAGTTAAVINIVVKGTSALTALNSYLLKIGAYKVNGGGSTPQITSILAQFFPNNVLDFNLLWPSGSQGYPLLRYHPNSDKIKNAMFNLKNLPHCTPPHMVHRREPLQSTLLSELSRVLIQTAAVEPAVPVAKSHGGTCVMLPTLSSPKVSVPTPSHPTRKFVLLCKKCRKEDSGCCCEDPDYVVRNSHCDRLFDVTHVD